MLRLNEAQIAVIVKNLEHWRRLEDKDSESFYDMWVETRDDFLRMLYTRISHDSLRHAAIIFLTINLLKGDQTPVARVPDEHLERIRKHLVDEKKVLKYAEGIVKRVPEGYVKLLLEQILADEKQHHKILLQMVRDSQGRQRRETSQKQK